MSALVGATVFPAGLTLNKILDPSSDATGVVEPVQKVELNFRSTGTIVELTVKPGDSVHQGEVLARQDNSVSAKAINSDKAAYEADKARLAELVGPPQPQQTQELQAPVDQAAAQLSSAQGGLAQIEAEQNSLVNSAAVAALNAQSTLNTDQAATSQTTATCAATPSGSRSLDLQDLCQRTEHQLAADADAAQTTQLSYEAAVTKRGEAVNTAEGAVTQATTALAAARAHQSVGLLPKTSADITAAQAAVAKDESTLAVDEKTAADTVLTAPFDGTIESVGGAVGDVASSDGVHMFDSPQPVQSRPTSGFHLFPEPPQSPTPQRSNAVSVITIDSRDMTIRAQVGEGDIRNVKVGMHATTTLPALPNVRLSGTVARVEPAAINDSGHTYFAVDIDIRASDVPAGVLPGMTADVSF